MIATITIQDYYKYDISIEARLDGDKLLWTAFLEESPMISFFDHSEKFQGNSIEEAILKISLAIDKAILLAKEI